jgi:hypothetical protein
LKIAYNSIKDGIKQTTDYLFDSNLKYKIIPPDIVNFDYNEYYFKLNAKEKILIKKYLDILKELNIEKIINKKINLPIFGITNLEFLASAYFLISIKDKIITFYFYKDKINDENYCNILKLTGCNDHKILLGNIYDKVALIAIEYDLEKEKILHKIKYYMAVKSLDKKGLSRIEDLCGKTITEIEEEFKLEVPIDGISISISDNKVKHFNYYWYQSDERR